MFSDVLRDMESVLSKIQALEGWSDLFYDLHCEYALTCVERAGVISSRHEGLDMVIGIIFQ